MYEDDQFVMAAIRAGASGYLLTGASQQEILRAIQAVASGDALFSAAIAKRIVAHLNQSPPGTLDRSVRELRALDGPGRLFRPAPARGRQPPDAVDLPHCAAPPRPVAGRARRAAPAPGLGSGP